ncbi:MAG: T9SS type A sorting domain-containing protein, partial [Saprospiraceae bacterium]
DPNILNIAIGVSNPKVIYLSSKNKIFKSTDKGNSWLNIGFSSDPITCIEVDPSNSNRLYITYGGYHNNARVEVTNDGGNSYNDLTGSLPNLPVNVIKCQKNANQALYLGTDVGLFYRDASKSDWELFNNNLPNVAVTSLDISYIDNKIWAGTYGRGLWSSNLFNSTATHDLNAKEFLLIENNEQGLVKLYNKNPQLKISQVEILDLNGKLIMKKSLLLPFQQVECNLVAGIYLVKFRAMGNQFIQKFIQL